MSDYEDARAYRHERDSLRQQLQQLEERQAKLLEAAKFLKGIVDAVLTEQERHANNSYARAAAAIAEEQAK